MSKLVWDTVGERFYETGVKNVVLYPQTTGGVYGAGVAWNGVTNITRTPTGAESNPVYADDIKYLDIRSIEEEEGSITAYTYPDEWAECDGSAALATGVMLHQQPRKAFGLCYRTIVGNDTEFNDHAYKIHLVYGATASPSEESHDTVNDSPEPVEMSWDYTTVPVAVKDHKNTSSIVIDSRTANDEYLAVLEGVLYGTDASGNNQGTAPKLPLPDEVKTIMTTGQIPS